jgi:hypothetical protein
MIKPTSGPCAGSRGIFLGTIKTLGKTLLFLLSLCGFLFSAVVVSCSGPLSPALAAANAEHVGHVSRIQGLVFALQAGLLRPLEQGAWVSRTDVLKTGPGARLEITMLDETRLTLGADTMLAVERYDLGRQKGDGAALLLLTKGVCRVATGRQVALREGPFDIVTPLATMSVRDSDFWGGFLEPEELDVLLIVGAEVSIRNDGGTSKIVKPLEGVRLFSPVSPPPEPSLWSPDKRARAFKSVAFD